MTKNNKSWWLWLILLVVIIMLPIIVNGMMHLSCGWTTGETGDWISFWGAYLGAIGSFAMALIAYKTLQKNDEQLKYIKEQNRPYLSASIRKYIQQKETGNNLSNLYRSHTYYLSIANHGNQIARNVHVELLLNDSYIANENIISRLEEINKAHFDLLANAERNFVIAEFRFPLDDDKKQIRERMDSYESFEKICLSITIKYESDKQGYCHEDSLFVRDTIVDSTTVVQMLDYIDNSLKRINENVGKLKQP